MIVVTPQHSNPAIIEIIHGGNTPISQLMLFHPPQGSFMEVSLLELPAGIIMVSRRLVDEDCEVQGLLTTLKRVAVLSTLADRFHRRR